MSSKLILYSLLFLLVACNNQEETPAGGPCAYKSNVLPARLIRLVGQDSLSIDAVFIITDTSGRKDTVRYSEINHRFLAAEEIRKDSLLIGKTYWYVEQDLVQGSCNPHLVSIRLKTE